MACEMSENEQHQPQLYQLELVVKTVTWCVRPSEFKDGGTDDDHGSGCSGKTVDVRFAGLEEQTVCRINADLNKTAAAMVTCVDRGQTYTFAMPAAKPSAPVPVCLFLRRQSDRVEIASGRLEVPLQPQPPPSHVDELSVAMKGRQNDQTVAVMTVRAHAWLAGQMTVTEVSRPAVTSKSQPKTKCCPPDPPLKVKCCTPDPAPKIKCCAPDPPPRVKCCPPDSPPKVKCCAPDPPPKVKCCDERRSRPATAATTCCHSHKKKSAAKTTCCVDQRTCNRQCDANPTVPDVPEPYRQYSSIGYEVDGRKVDLRVRKKNYETCAVQRQIANEAEAFAARVMTAVREMHGLVTTTLGTKSDDSL